MKHPDWIATTNALPGDGESIEFRVAERSCPLRGSYRYGRFCSRWIGYVPAVVSEWRDLCGTAQPARVEERPTPRPAARQVVGEVGLAGHW